MAFSTAVLSSPSLYLGNRRPILQQKVRSSLSSSSPSVSIKFDLQSYWTTVIAEIKHKLDEALPVQYPQQIYEAMRYPIIASAAKGAAPVMCVAACELFGGNRLGAFPTACALEMVHAASLILDDLPCMDDDSSRQGQFSNHTACGVDMAILACDALFPLGFRHIVSHTPPDLVPKSQVLRVVAEMARAMGPTGRGAGQFLDLEGGATSVESVLEKKFGEMGECSAACGGLLAGAGDDEIQRLRRYGRSVGVLYQVVEDVLEEKKKSEEGDKEENKKVESYVGVYGVEKAVEMVENLRSTAKRELAGFEKYGEKVLPLYGLVDYAVDREFSVGDQD